MEGKVLGCSRCRYSAKGCSRCKKPNFTHRGPRALPGPSGGSHSGASGGSQSGGVPAAAAPAVPSKPAASSQRREEAAAPQANEPPRRERVRKRRAAGLNNGPDAEHSDLYMAVAHELQQLEQLQQDLQSLHQHRKRSRQHDGHDAVQQPDGNAVAKRLRTALQGSAAAGRPSTDGPSQQQQHASMKHERGAGSQGDADMLDAAAVAGEASGQEAAHAEPGTAPAAGERPSSGSFAATLEARVKQQLAQGRTPVLSPNGKAAGSQHASAAAAAAKSAEQAEQRAVKVKAEADLAALAAELGVLAASVSDGAVSSDSAGAAGSPKTSQQQQRSSSSAEGTPPAPLAAGTSASAGAEAGAAAAGSTEGSPVLEAAAAAASPGGSSSPRSDGKPSTRRRTSAPKVKPYAHLVLPGVNPKEAVPGWQAPASPFGLLEEELWQSPWKLLLGCMLLNKTSGKQVRRVFWKLLELCPTPEAAIAADTAAIRDIIAPLGLHNKRAVAVQRLSQDFVQKEWTCPTELYGIGKYAADAYYIFCKGQWEGVQPDDKDLIKYHEWLRSTGGQGMALEPAQTAAAAAATAEAVAAMAEAAPDKGPGSGDKASTAAAEGGGDAAEGDACDAPSLEAAAAEADAAGGSGPATEAEEGGPASGVGAGRSKAAAGGAAASGGDGEGGEDSAGEAGDAVQGTPAPATKRRVVDSTKGGSADADGGEQKASEPAAAAGDAAVNGVAGSPPAAVAAAPKEVSNAEDAQDAAD